MQFELRTFDTQADLLARASEAAADGPLVQTHRDEDEPCLLWLDRLAAQRTDWHAAIGETLVQLGTSEDAEAQSAVVDFFHKGATAAAFASAGTRILQTRPDAASLTERLFAPQAAPLRLDSLLPNVLETAALRSQHDQSLLFAQPETALVTLTNAQDLLLEAQVAIECGHSRIDGGIDGWYILDWIRSLSLFVPWIRAEVPGLLRALVDSGDPAAINAVVEFALRCGDKADLLPLVQQWLDAGPPWGEEFADIVRLDDDLETLGDCLRRVLADAQDEQASAPQPNPS